MRRVADIWDKRRCVSSVEPIWFLGSRSGILVARTGYSVGTQRKVARYGDCKICRCEGVLKTVSASCSGK